MDELRLGLVGLGDEPGYDGADDFGFGHGSSPEGGMGELRCGSKWCGSEGSGALNTNNIT
ncbi:hypothetical protein GCM10010269_19760 [Streptomyces humidus]|uniref:Uncharacterized protein n=1 Tax=Streptomyces humidus TaxID=52259 RepID=A0A918FUG3_9ACTN|nr:hypothetical protein GCM10010269_19760 [Streptomyces humidus]